MANRTDACFIRVIGSELVQKYVGEGARMVRELFQMARAKKACLIFFDEALPPAPPLTARACLVCTLPACRLPRNSQRFDSWCSPSPGVHRGFYAVVVVVAVHPTRVSVRGLDCWTAS